MNILKLFGVVVFGSLLCHASGAEQRETIWLSTSLSIGMSKSEVLSKLTEHYNLSKAPGDIKKGEFEFWAVFSKGARSYSVGTILFKDGKLKRVTKDWGPEDPEKGASFANGLYKAFNSFIKEKKHECWIDATKVEAGAIESKSIYVVCGQKYIEIGIIRAQPPAVEHKTEQASVSENLGDPPVGVLANKLIHELKKAQARK